MTDLASPLPSARKLHVAAVLLLFLATFATYWPVQEFEFLNYDDQTMVTENAVVRGGLGWEGIRWAFTTRADSNWNPVTWLSHMTDVELFGMHSGRHHMVSVCFHALNAILLYLALAAMTQAPARSVLVAALFAVHPLHAESVAWIAERKDVLSGFFWFACVGIYYHYSKRRSRALYAALLSCFALGLLSKPMLVTLPVVLLLLDLWPLRRWAPSSPARDGEPAAPSSGLFPLFLEKVPLLVMSGAMGLVTFLAQRQGGAVVAIEHLNLGQRISNALISYVRYLDKTFSPRQMAAFYPLPPGGWPAWKAALAAVLLLGVTAAALSRWRKRPYLAVGWLWYVITLLPVIGIVQVGGQAMADRFTYLPLTGIFILVVWGLEDVLRRVPGRALVLSLSALFALGILVVLSRQQVSYWRDTKTLFGHALDVTEGNYFAHSVLGSALSREGKKREAMLHYAEAVRTGPYYAMGHYNYANSLSRVGRNSEAIEHYRKAIEILPGEPRIHNNLGVTLAGLGRLREAVFHYREALRYRPDFALAHKNLGDAYYRSGAFEAAAESYAEALRINPEIAGARGGLSQSLRRAGNRPAARAPDR